MAYTFVAAGTISVAGSPGQPAGKASGDLLILYGTQRAAGVAQAVTGYTLLKTNAVREACCYWGRIATNDASDSISGATLFTNSSEEVCQLAAFRGGGYTDLATIVVHSADAGSGSNTAEIPNPAITITTANCLVLGGGSKQKTVTADGASFTSPAGLNNRIGLNATAGDKCLFVWDYTIQTTATNISASTWNQTPNESLPYSSTIIALQSVAPGNPWYQYAQQ